MALDAMTDDLTLAEQAFRALLENPKAYSAWAREVRLKWMAERRGK
jgi:hypothetical protein